MPWRQIDLWTARQRRALIVLASVAIIVLAIRLALNPNTVPDPQPTEGVFSGQLADRIDPNTASAAELAAIPTLGEKRAQAITDFRDGYMKLHHGKAAFARPEDLLRVKGIGAAIAETLEPYLLFPDAAASRP